MGYGLIGHWCPSFTQNTGFQLLDISEFNNIGLLSNMLSTISTCWTNSRDKIALTFDGVDDFVNFGNIPALNSLPLSFSCWYRPSGTTGFRTIFEKYSSAPAGVFCFQNAAAISFQMGGSGSPNRVTGGTLVAGEWYHVAATVSSTLITLYINGTSVGTPIAPGSANSGSANLTLANSNSGVSNGNGMIDDFRIYSLAWTASEVLATHQAGRGGGLLYEPPRRKTYFVPPVSGWQSYWFRNQQRMIGGGIR